MSFSPDGKTLALVDGSLVLWNIELKSWIARACRMANRNLSRDEWDRYLKDKPFRETCSERSDAQTLADKGLVTFVSFPATQTPGIRPGGIRAGPAQDAQPLKIQPEEELYSPPPVDIPGGLKLKEPSKPKKVRPPAASKSFTPPAHIFDKPPPPPARVQGDSPFNTPASSVSPIIAGCAVRIGTPTVIKRQ